MTCHCSIECHSIVVVFLNAQNNSNISKYSLRPEVSKKFKSLKLLVTVTVILRIEVEVSKMKSILKWILSLIS